MLRVLYTYRNFEKLSPNPPGYLGDGSNHMLKASFVDDIMQQVFRITPKRPPVNKLTDTGYCYNNGYYHFSGGYSTYYATGSYEITDTFRYDKDTLYIVFTDVYTSAGVSRQEYSSARIAQDDNGMYISAIRMNSDFSDVLNNDNPQPSDLIPAETRQWLLIVVIILLAIAAAGIIVYTFII